MFLFSMIHHATGFLANHMELNRQLLIAHESSIYKNRFSIAKKCFVPLFTLPFFSFPCSRMTCRVHVLITRVFITLLLTLECYDELLHSTSNRHINKTLWATPFGSIDPFFVIIFDKKANGTFFTC